MEKKTLKKSSIWKAYWDWIFWNLSVQNFERMEGPAIVKMLADVREELYPGNVEKQKEMLKRHTIFFNTEPFLGSIVPGIVLGMEYQMAQGDGDMQPELINAIKTALMGPFAGIGDSLLPGTLCPILLSIALGLCQNGEILGPIFYVIVFLVIMFPLTWFLFSYGVKTGANAAELVLGGGIKDQVTKAAETVGLIVVGAVTAQYTHVNVGLVYTSGDLTVNVGNILNTIMPGLSVMIMSLIAYVLVVKKKWTTNKMLLFFLVVAIIGYFAKILIV